MSPKECPPNGHLSQWIIDQFEPGYRGWCVDVGASDGISISTTWSLEKVHYWGVLCVEANPDFGPALKQRRMWVEMCACSDRSADSAEFHVNEENPESFSALKIAEHPLVRKWADPQKAGLPWKKIRVPVKTLDELLAKWEFPRLDALCVDVEGGELEVLKGCDLERWKPRVIVSEAWDSGHEYPYLYKHGYRMVARNVHNDLYKLAEEA